MFNTLHTIYFMYFLKSGNILIAHCMQEMIAISSDACYQIVPCACILNVLFSHDLYCRNKILFTLKSGYFLTQTILWYYYNTRSIVLSKTDENRCKQTLASLP